MDSSNAALFGRRALLAGAGCATLATAGGAAFAQHQPPLGMWTDGPHGLPAYRYTGPLAFGRAKLIPDDPWFLLGNHRLTLFVHASGRLRFFNGQRGWARMNGDGVNRATLVLDGTPHMLTGMEFSHAAAAEKLFAPGLARFTYMVGEIEIVRSLCAPPSRHVGEGPCALLITVSLRNTRKAGCTLAYSERLTGDYQPIWPPGSRNAARVRHERTPHVQDGVASIATRAVVAEALSLPPRPAVSEFDADPPRLWIAPVSSGLTATAEGCEIGVGGEVTLAPGETRMLRFAFGASFAPEEIDAARARFAAAPEGDAPFAPDWVALLPDFPHERDTQIRREMRWNAAALEAMATWREYYGETVVPQGTTYDYEWGFTGWTRDVAQHALPLCRTNPALARSVLRYIFKRTTPEGEVKLGDSGFGWVPPGPWVTSDQQLYTFLLAAEYVQVTGDRGVLDETVDCYPREAGARVTGLEHLTRCFLYVRDRIGTGAHGLVKLWNSDWNDMFYAAPKSPPYSELFGTAESHLNTALAIVVLGRLAGALAPYPGARPLADAMTAYRSQLLTAYLADLDGRAFPRRAYLGRGGAVGEDRMWLEPVGYTLQILEFAEPARRALIAAFEARLLTGEPIGPRQIEDPPPLPGLPAGARENGGVWWSLAGPVALGLASTDPDRARALVARMGFANYAVQHAGVWTGAWTASDSLDSARLPTAGLSIMQPWCAHAHAWPLHAYLTLAGGSAG